MLRNCLDVMKNVAKEEEAFVRAHYLRTLQFKSIYALKRHARRTKYLREMTAIYNTNKEKKRTVAVF